MVRESQGSPGQYVLTGMNNGTPKHLLLIDPEGVVSIVAILALYSFAQKNAQLKFISISGTHKRSRFRQRKSFSKSSLRQRIANYISGQCLSTSISNS